MKRTLVCLFFLSLLTFSCQKKEQKINWNPTLSHTSKDPYGAYLCYQMLREYFKEEKVTTLSQRFSLTSMDDHMQFEQRPNVLFIIGLEFYLNKAELNQLLTFARSGNEVVIVSSVLSKDLLNYFLTEKKDAGFENTPLTQKSRYDIESLHQLSITPLREERFSYRGRSIESWFDIDTAGLLQKDASSFESLNASNLNEFYGGYSDENKIEVLGYHQDQPNFIRFTTGEGHVSFHAAPLAFSNYFLLQKNNNRYLEAVLQHLPNDVGHFYWMDFTTRHAHRSTLSVLLRYPATKWAFGLALTGLLLYVFVESKRRQRIIPVFRQNDNTTAIFAETVGRLYYNKGNHRNLAEKMIQHFLEWVRNTYFLPTTYLNEAFVQNLSLKSGKNLEETRVLIETIYSLRAGQEPLTEQGLLTLYHRIHSFYEKH